VNIPFVFFFAPFLIASGWVAHVAAADPEPSETQKLSEARSAFVDGRKFMERGEWEQAEKAFLFAAEVKNTPGLRYYVASCQEQAGRLLDAFASYEEAARLMKEQPAADVEALIPVAIERVRSALPQVAVQGAPAGATALVDGRALARALAGPVDPGEHQIRVEAEGFLPWEGSVTLAPGEAEVVEVEMKPVGQPEEEPVNVSSETIELPAESSAYRPVVFWGSVGVGVASLGLGVFGLIHRSSGSAAASEASIAVDSASGGSASACASPSGDLARQCTKLQDGIDKKDLGTLLMVTGFAGAGVGAASALLTHFFWEDSGTDVAALVSPKGAFLRVSSQF